MENNTALIQWLIGALATTTVVIITGVVVLLRVAFKLGTISNRVTDACADLKEHEKAVRSVPLHEHRISQLESANVTIRRRVYRIGSNPDINNDDEDEL